MQNHRYKTVPHEVKVFKILIDSAAEEYAWRESIFPSKRKQAKAAYINALFESGTVTDLKRWSEVEERLAWYTADNFKSTLALFWMAVVTHACARALFPQLWAEHFQVLITYQVAMFVNWVLPRAQRGHCLSVWRSVWRTSSLNPSREEVTESRKRVGAPRSAYYLLWLVTPRENRRDSIEEINGDYETVKSEFGVLRAHVFYWGELIKTVWVSWGGEALKELVKWYFRDSFMK